MKWQCKQFATGVPPAILVQVMPPCYEAAIHFQLVIGNITYDTTPHALPLQIFEDELEYFAPMPNQITQKQLEFNAAMAKYESVFIYRFAGVATSFIVILLQALLAVLASQQTIGPKRHLLTLVLAYVLADFVNGLVHMYMDNSDGYTSPFGPLIAAFHLHHRTPLYRQRPLLAVYFQESGSKIWLAVVLVIAAAAVWQGRLSGIGLYGMLYFTIFSSLAEVSHYLCHVPHSWIAGLPGKVRLLLPSSHHARHHVEDNVNYGFLNGMTDPVLNVIAKALFKGYKNTTDTHYSMYAGLDTQNRM